MRPTGVAKPASRWAWIAVAWGLVLAGWKFLISAKAPPIERVYLPILLVKFLVPELLFVVMLCVGYLFRKPLRAHAERAIVAFRKVALPGARDNLWIYLAVFASVTLSTSPFWWPKTRSAAGHLHQLILHRPRYYQLLFVDYYGDALRNESKRAYERGYLQKALKLYDAADAWTGSPPDENDAMRKTIAGRLQYAQNQAARSRSTTDLGLSPLSVALDMEAARAFPGNGDYRAKLIQDLREIRRLSLRIVQIDNVCQTANTLEIGANEQYPFDSFLPGSIKRGSKPTLNCVRFRQVCKTTSAECAQDFMYHMQSDRLLIACQSVETFAEGRQATAECR